MNSFSHEVIFCIVNAGFSEAAMEAAKDAGARGGTILNARGTANKDAETFFQIAVQPEKEIVMILVDAKIKDAVLHALYQKAGLDTMGRGIAFSLPVENVVGLTPWKLEEQQKNQSAKKAEQEKENSAENMTVAKRLTQKMAAIVRPSDSEKK